MITESGKITNWPSDLELGNKYIFQGWYEMAHPSNSGFLSFHQNKPEVPYTSESTFNKIKVI